MQLQLAGMRQVCSSPLTRQPVEEGKGDRDEEEKSREGKGMGGGERYESSPGNKAWLPWERYGSCTGSR